MNQSGQNEQERFLDASQRRTKYPLTKMEKTKCTIVSGRPEKLLLGDKPLFLKRLLLEWLISIVICSLCWGLVFLNPITRRIVHVAILSIGSLLIMMMETLRWKHNR